MTKNKKYTTRELLQRFIPYFYKYKTTLFIDLFCAMLTTINEMILPMILRYLTNTGIENPEALSIQVILLISGLYLILKVVDIIANYYMNNIGHVMGAMIETDMRRDAFNHLQNLSDSFYNKTKVGQIMSRITNDLFDVTEFAHHCPEEYFIGFIKIVVSFIILININIPLTLIIYFMIPIMIFSASKINRRVRKTFRKQRNHIGDINASIEDTLLGVRVVKSFANEDYEIARFQEENDEFLDIKRDTYKNLSMFHSVTRIFDGLMYVTVILFGGIFMVNGSILPGDLVAYVLFVTTLLNTVRRIVEFTENFHKGMTGIERFVELMDTDIDIFDSEDAKELTDVKGHILFDNVSFKYDSSDDYVLKDIDIEIKPGENIALVGPSGGGKTTISNLIPRFYDVTEGAISIDGTDIRDLQIKSLRSNIGMVQQDVYLFSGTVYENIAYGKPGASLEDVIAAAKLAGADEFIDKLPEGYDTYVGERGLRLSGGQKQRISIARVFLKNPPILILDEATSALDNKSERLIQNSLEELAKGRTTLTIAHRLSTIMDANRIIVLTEDGIQEMGTHDELLKSDGLYANLYKRSFGDMNE
ncbi:MAG: ABC transporter ATP-binding protein [Tissierellia bacterium]|nr:ABC transporter ATP-binding protein [Tissierellia bacterium]